MHCVIGPVHCAASDSFCGYNVCLLHIMSFVMCTEDDMRQCDISVATFRQQVLGTTREQPGLQMDL